MRAVGTGLVTWLLERVCWHLWDFKVNMWKPFVQITGPFPTLRWFVSNMPRYERIRTKEWGNIRTHLITSAISILNGCRYCAVGHIMAFQLYYLQSTESLFPLDDEEMSSLRTKTNEEAIIALKKALVDGRLPDEVPYIDRMFELFRDNTLGDPNSADDGRHLAMISMFAQLNKCGIEGDPPLDAIHDPINLDKALLNRYKTLRGSSAS